MRIFLGFAPWILFWVLLSNDSFRVAAFASLISVAIINYRDFKTKSVKVLDLGTLVFFSIIAVVSIFKDPKWLETWLHVLGNTALFLIALVSIGIRQPFTIQYAREEVDEKFWNTPRFYATNLTITWIWCAAFLVQTLSSALTILWPQHETLFSWFIPIGSFVAAIKFTAWYPEQVKARAAN